MRCELCRNNTATIHITQVSEGRVKVVHVCDDCKRDRTGNDAPGEGVEALLNQADGEPILPATLRSMGEMIQETAHRASQGLSPISSEVARWVAGSIVAKTEMLSTELPAIERIAEALIDGLRSGRRVYLMGNGGSAADAQHLAAELIGRYKMERRALPAVALTVDTSALTSIGNDYGFDEVFARQLDGLVEAEDIVIGISTSGNSPNVIKAIELANERGAVTIGFTGRAGGKLAEICAHCLKAPADETAHVQECHITIGHILCDLVEQALFGEDED